MRKSKFTETQIITKLKELESGKKTNDLCGEHGISAAAFFKWNSKYSGMKINELKLMRELEEENATNIA